MSAPSPNAAAERRALRARWTALQAELATRESARFRVGVVATVTADPLLPYLGCALAGAGLAPRLVLAPYNQIFQTCLDGGAALGPDPLDVTLFHWRLEDIAGETFAQAHNERAEDALNAAIDQLAQALAMYRKARTGLMLLTLPAFPVSPHVDRDGLIDSLRVGRLHRRATERFLDAVSGLMDVAFIDLDGLVRELGHAAAHDVRTGYLYRQPYSEAFWATLGARIARIVSARRTAPRKAIAIDCDNTLWGGVVGEDGLAGLKLGGDFPGQAFRDLQARLLDLKAQGVLLTLLSKNNEADVWEVFDRHEGMLLKKSDIVAWRIDWNPKPDNLRALAAELNLGTDAFVFLDDSPFETEHMRSERPEVLTIRLPEEPADFLEVLSASHAFDRVEVTAEDRARSDMYLQERARQTAQEVLSPKAFLGSLGLTLRLAVPTDDQLARVSQLINKTNQFNLTTIRRSPDEVSTLARSPSHRLWAAWVADRFGDYGLTGLAIVEIRGAEWHLDTFLLSCRVLARGIETALISAIGEAARAAGAQTLRARFIPTAKNTPAAGFLPSHGFADLGETHFELRVADAPAFPSHLRVVLD